MANKITPKTFLIILIPLAPIKRSIRLDVFRTIKITKTFKITATIIFSIANSALNDNRVVKLPGPAINGKASGNNRSSHWASIVFFIKCDTKYHF